MDDIIALQSAAVTLAHTGESEDLAGIRRRDDVVGGVAARIDGYENAVAANNDSVIVSWSCHGVR